MLPAGQAIKVTPSKMTAAKIPIFSAGCYQTLLGGCVCLGVQDLAITATAYHPSHFQAPLTLGNPKTGDPAAGWVDTLTVEGTTLLATASRISPALRAWVAGALRPRAAASFFAPDEPGNPSPGIYYLRDVRLHQGDHLAPTPSNVASFTTPERNMNIPPFKVPQGYTVPRGGLDSYRSFLEARQIAAAFQ